MLLTLKRTVSKHCVHLFLLYLNTMKIKRNDLTIDLAPRNYLDTSKNIA